MMVGMNAGVLAVLVRPQQEVLGARLERVVRDELQL